MNCKILLDKYINLEKKKKLSFELKVSLDKPSEAYSEINIPNDDLKLKDHTVSHMQKKKKIESVKGHCKNVLNLGAVD